MKLPFVSRAAFNAVFDQLARSEARYDALLARYHGIITPGPTMMVNGATVPLKPELVPREPNPVRDAIKAEAGGDPRLASYLWKRVRQLRGEGMSEGDIVAEIGRWDTTESTEAHG